MTQQNLFYITPHQMAQQTSPPGGVKEPDLREIIGSFARHLWMIAAFTVLGLVIGVFFVVKNPPKYEAQSFIMVKAPEQSISFDGKIMPFPSASPPAESTLLSEVEVLRSRDLAEAVLNDLHLDQDDHFWQGMTKPRDNADFKSQALQYLIKNVKAQPVGRSLVIELSFRHANAAMAATIVNRMVQLYQEQQVRDKIIAARKTSDWLQERLDTLGRKLQKSSQALEEYRARENLVDGAKAELTSEQISDLGSQIVAAETDLATAKAQQEQLQEVADNKKSLEDISQVFQSHMINLLSHDEATLQSDYAEMKSKYGPNHPKLLAIQAEIRELGQKKAKEISHIKENLNNDVITYDAKLQKLKKTLAELEEKRRRENKASIGLRELQREEEADRALYETFLNRQKEVSMMSDIEQPDSKIISLARIPATASNAPAILIILFCSFAGFLFSLLVALVLEQLESYIRTARDLERLTGAPVLGMLPELRKSARADLVDYLSTHPDHPLANSIHTLRVRIADTLTAGSAQVITLTSCLAGEGKTTSAILLARSLAQGGARVLLIDADMRRPSIAPLLHLYPDFSISDVLLGKKIEQQTIVPDPKQVNLSILAGKPATLDQISALSVTALRAFIERLKKQYDFIIIDTPPYLSASETHFFTTLADQCLFVVRWDYTPVEIMQTAYRQMKQDKIEISGFILSRMHPNVHLSAHYMNMKSHYGYSYTQKS